MKGKQKEGDESDEAATEAHKAAGGRRASRAPKGKKGRAKRGVTKKVNRCRNRVLGERGRKAQADAVESQQRSPGPTCATSVSLDILENSYTVEIILRESVQNIMESRARETIPLRTEEDDQLSQEICIQETSESVQSIMESRARETIPLRTEDDDQLSQEICIQETSGDHVGKVCDGSCDSQLLINITMDKCKHVGRLRLAQDHSILNPQKWHCVDCNTTESVWACLGCSHVACGRYIEEHALKHFKESEHPVALEVNELYVFCYLCDDYVLNDNATGDLKLLRSTLSAIKSQNYDCTTRSGRTLRSMAASDDTYPTNGGAQAMLQNEDRMFTALWHRRHALMGRVFRAWFEKTTLGQLRLEEEKRLEEAEMKKEERQKRRKELKRQWKAEFENTPPRKSSRLQKETYSVSTKAASVAQRVQQKPAAPSKPTTCKVDEVRLKKIGDSPSKRRPTVTPGVTGLRNLGNTCYMNSILQILSHLNVFRECFLQLDLNQAQELLPSTANGKTTSRRPPAILQAFQDQAKAPVARRPSLSSGLSGGASKRKNMELIQPKEPSSKHISLCHELHTLFHVMWSGKWALVSPFAMLHSVWRLIPAFRGYAQQDAQEFLCELLDKVQQELETAGTRYQAIIPGSQKKLITQVLNVVNTIFQGQLLSQVTCLACDNKSNTVEPFWDLSLEFPERYHCSGKDAASLYPCLLTEMLAKFTETEALEGKIYACDLCNMRHLPVQSVMQQSCSCLQSGRGDRATSTQSARQKLSEAQKQLMVCQLPQVLRLHLKRFRWSGRNHREKIGVHVNFDQMLNMEPYCCRESTKSLLPECFIYDLSAVVMHHGKGFGSGHYTAFCYNPEGGFWVHCNDSKLNICTVEEVCKVQAYILFYTQRVAQETGHSLNEIPCPAPPLSNSALMEVH
ncbi:ubiquitin carboxyl-terminal hydrolase 44 isoform X2 [Ambystoma mexicanum]|uniref:ubiquitin carboxyl-terminal hydrolase 44 isoform X2 n=1 Tax=Ambystoma mexicanum TaxID=8296 RepID=UPI0037E926CA